MSIIMTILAAGAISAAEAPRNPLQGNEGSWLLCAEPDDIDKTCRSLSRYTATAEPGRYTEVDWMSVPGLPGLLLEVTTKGYVKDGRLCGIVRRSNFIGARVVRHAEGLTRQQEAAVIRTIGYAYPFEGKEACAELVPDTLHLTALAYVNGKPFPELTSTARWVHEGDGYTVQGWTPPTALAAR